MKILLSAYILLLPFIALGYSYNCKKGRDERALIVAFNNDHFTNIPCTALYMKKGNIRPSATWRSRYNARFCEKKVDDGAKLLRKRGFICEFSK